MRLLLVAIALLFVSVTVQAQDFTPSLIVGTGVSYDYYGKNGFASTTFVAVKAASRVYPIITVDLTKDRATSKGGVGIMLFHQGHWSLLGLGDVGASTGDGPLLASLSGGGMLAYDIGAKVTKDKEHFYVAFGGRAHKDASLGLQPILGFQFAKVF